MPRPGLTNERLTALFLLAVGLFTPPFLGIFNSPARMLGIPLLYLYLFIAWTLLIAVIALVVERADASSDKGESAETEARGEPGSATPVE